MKTGKGRKQKGVNKRRKQGRRIKQVKEETRMGKETYETEDRE